MIEKYNESHTDVDIMDNSKLKWYLGKFNSITIYGGDSGSEQIMENAFPLSQLEYFALLISENLFSDIEGGPEFFSMMKRYSFKLLLNYNNNPGKSDLFDDELESKFLVEIGEVDSKINEGLIVFTPNDGNYYMSYESDIPNNYKLWKIECLRYIIWKFNLFPYVINDYQVDAVLAISNKLGIQFVEIYDGKLHYDEININNFETLSQLNIKGYIKKLN